MVKSKKRKKSKKKLLIALLLTFLVLAASAAAVSNITITEMSVEGNKHYTKEEIRDILFGTAKERNTLYCFLNQNLSCGSILYQPGLIGWLAPQYGKWHLPLPPKILI